MQPVLGFAKGFPQFGQLAASLETLWPQSGQA